MKHVWLSLIALIGLTACPQNNPEAPPNPPAYELPSKIPAGSPDVAENPVKVPAKQVHVPHRQRFTNYPPAEVSCSTHDDCQLVSALRTDPGLMGCCRKCLDYVAGTRAWAVKAVEACKAAGPCNNPLNCPLPTVNPYRAECERGSCVVKRDPVVWGENR